MYVLINEQFTYFWNSILIKVHSYCWIKIKSTELEVDCKYLYIRDGI